MLKGDFVNFKRLNGLNSQARLLKPLKMIKNTCLSRWFVYKGKKYWNTVQVSLPAHLFYWIFLE
jgi:hypothetical protein